GRAPAHLRAAGPLAASDGERIHLPEQLDAADGPDAALARYRVMAIGQAERLMRGTAALAPGADEPLARDLYLLLESAAADATIAEDVPGVRPALQAERAAALARRPALDALTEPEREVETLVRALLAGDAAAPPPELAPGATPAESLERARTLAAGVRAVRGRYRGVPMAGAWGTVIRVDGTAGGAMDVGPVASAPLLAAPSTGSKRGMGVGLSSTPAEGAPPVDDPWAAAMMDDDPSGGTAPPDAPSPSEPDPPGTGGSGDAPGGGGGDAGTADRAPGAPPAQPAVEAFPYPEWNSREGRYVQRAVWVRPREAVEGDGAWPAAVLAAHGALVRRLRERFERLRAQRARLMRQRDGEELDLDACVRAIADRATGHSIDDRLYVAVRPARRGLAIALLVDISGSTSEHVEGMRIIDIEKVAVLLTGEALDALGDLYAVLAFSGVGPGDVRVRTLKDFGERNGGRVRARIAALEPEGFTRMGAAVRHATALLARQPAGHRLLLILSDGKPNDQDHYQDRYAVEDSRQAILEARAVGVHPFCLTVDRKASGYLTRIFGEPGHMILRRADQLPLALVKVVRQLLSNR
ncbi:MAG TPA: VWA domain-containing protein, partial [Longimicrobium sp.]|nr:VWA domain-containing protein [Longimicrobium sp.]